MEIYKNSLCKYQNINIYIFWMFFISSTYLIISNLIQSEIRPKTNPQNAP